MTDIIRIENLVKEYPGHWRKASKIAVDDVSFCVPAGEAFGFVGANGAGKSTTIKILTGIVEPTSGKARLFDLPVSDPHCRIGVGYVPENPYLFDYLTPLEILQMGVRLHKCAIQNINQHCKKWLERLDLGAVANQPIRSFSKGMTQRVAIAQALAVQPKLLILDEPLSGLDPIGRRDVVELLAEFKKEGGTLFFTSHVLHDVERLADRFGLIHRGKLTAVRSPGELAKSDDQLLVRSAGSQKVQFMRLDSIGRWSADVHREDLWSLLEALKAADHEVIEIRPTLSLESVFMQVVNGN